MRFLSIAGTMVLTAGGWCAAQGPSGQPHPVPVTRLELKKALEAYKFAKPRLPLPPLSEAENAAGVQGPDQVRMRRLHLDPDVGALWPSDYNDTAMTLPRNIKRPLLWVTSRVNNCLY